MKPVKNEFHIEFSVNLQDVFIPFASLGDFVRGRMSPSGMVSEGERQVNGLFESMLSESFS